MRLTYLSHSTIRLEIGDVRAVAPTDAVDAVRPPRADRVVPIRHDAFPPIRQDAEAFREDVAARTDARCDVLDPGQSLRL